MGSSMYGNTFPVSEHLRRHFDGTILSDVHRGIIMDMAAYDLLNYLVRNRGQHNRIVRAVLGLRYYRWWRRSLPNDPLSVSPITANEIRTMVVRIFIQGRSR